ncbi:MAG TPA: hypothetical protein VMF63_12505 [Opitutaceae bacterium]|nr:hypothetical protein [Opitutaceae bacterium]
MSKWLLAAAAALLLVGFAYRQFNAVKVEYVNGLPEYNRLPGKEYIFERDCYIFKFKARDTTWPLVGANVPGAPMTVPELPAEVAPRYVGASLPAVRILDIAHTGDRFRIISVRRDTSRRGSAITFEIVFLNVDGRLYPRLDAYWIIDHTPERRGAAPSLLPGYAVPRVMD